MNNSERFKIVEPVIKILRDRRMANSAESSRLKEQQKRLFQEFAKLTEHIEYLENYEFHVTDGEKSPTPKLDEVITKLTKFRDPPL